MGDNVRDCKRIAETTESSTTRFTKKPKICIDFEELQVPLSNFKLRKDCAVVNSSERPSNSGGDVDGDPCSSSCFSQTSRCSSTKIVEECSRFVDREAKSFETEDSACITSRLTSREATPSSDFFCADTNEIDSPLVAEKSRPEKPVAPARPVGTEMPSLEEIETFFEISEKLEQKRFIEKYNFDVVDGVPLEGRYQWVRLK